MTPAKPMRLTPELVARVHREVADPGPSPGITLFGEADYDAHLAEFLDHGPKGPVHVFCYGSLIWKPVFEPAAQRHGVARGWERRFCLRIARWRGTREFPGLMMQIDRGGGQCEGVLQELDGARQWQDLSTLWRREMTTNPPSNYPRWIDVESEGKSLRAIAFTANPETPNYAGHLPDEHVAQVLSRACGHWGSGAEYLHQTVVSLAKADIHDQYLWDLQERVAELIEGQEAG